MTKEYKCTIRYSGWRVEIVENTFPRRMGERVMKSILDYYHRNSTKISRLWGKSHLEKITLTMKI